MSALVIENLEICPSILGKNEMNEYEPFECSVCGKMCRMEIERFNLFTEAQISTAIFKCRECSGGIGRGRSSDELKNVTKEQLEQWIADSLTKKEMCKRLKCHPPALQRRLRMFGLLTVIDTKPNEPVSQHHADDTQHNDHIPDVSNMVEHPPHYTQGGIECIDAIEAAVEGLPGRQAYLVGNIIKYVWRYMRKNGVEDLLKAKWYLERLIALVSQK
jgi:hypothetical protein